MSESDQKEKKGVPRHKALLARMIKQGDIKPLQNKIYFAMEQAILECQSQVLLGVNTKWVEWAKTVKDPTIFSQASDRLTGLPNMDGIQFSRHRMILGSVPKWDEPSRRPYILTCSAPYVHGPEFVENRRVYLQKYYEARYQQAYAQLTLSKKVGKTHYYRENEAWLDTTFLPSYLDPADKKAAMYLTFYAYKKAAEDIGGIVVHSMIVCPGNKKDLKRIAELARAGWERRVAPGRDEVLKFEVGTFGEAMEQHWKEAVFENLGSGLRVGGDYLNRRELEQMIARDYALIETQSTTLNATLKNIYSYAKNPGQEVCKNFHVINPPEAGPMPKLPYQVEDSKRQTENLSIDSLMKAFIIPTLVMLANYGSNSSQESNQQEKPGTYRPTT